MRFFPGLLLTFLVFAYLDARAASPAPATTSDAGSVVVPLDGAWSTAQDLSDVGVAQRWFTPANFPNKAAKPIFVPGGLPEAWHDWAGDPNKDVAWYIRTFPVAHAAAPHTRYYLRFSGVFADTFDVWLNGTQLARHTGTQDPFEYDVTSLVQAGQPNTVAARLKVWGGGPIPLGGITNHVALVAQPEVRLIDVFARPDAAAQQMTYDVTVENDAAAPAQVDLTAALAEFKSGHALGTQKQTITAAPGLTVTHLIQPVAKPHLWDLNDPFLYKVSVTSDWKQDGAAAALHDAESFHTGFRDFRVVNGYFTLNGKRLFLKSIHGNWGDPVTIIGTPRDMTYLGKDVPQLKAAGFNTFRFIVSSAYPEQLDIADEQGFLMYSEHPTSWLLKDPARFGDSLNQLVRRDRNHPSLVMWGLLNETSDQRIYARAKPWLPSLRKIDDTRTILLSSGRWDMDYKTGSISNPGSSTWDTYLGGQDPQNPRVQDFLKGLGNFGNVSGDDHMYPMFPITWDWTTGFGKVDEGGPHPFFFSESGMGSVYDAIEIKRQLQKVHAPAVSVTWDYANAGADGIVKSWKDYGFYGTYPNPEDAFIDSALESAQQRALLFSIIRANPMVMGYNLTSLNDCWDCAEGIFNEFREWKPGHEKVMKEGWAPLRWCLLINPTNLYIDTPLHVKVALSNEDVLAPGDYPATLEIKGPGGSVWKQAAKAHFEPNGPFANIVFDQDVTVPGLKAGNYTLTATLEGHANAAANSVPFVVADRAALPSVSGAVTVLGVPQNVRDLLTKQGAKLHDYAVNEQIDGETIVIGPGFKGKAADWRALYARAARGAHLVFISSGVFHDPRQRNKWLALPSKGDQHDGPDWLYHKDIIAKANDPFFAGLPTKLMTADFYGPLLANVPFFFNNTPPAAKGVSALSIFNQWGGPHYWDGGIIETYPFHAGGFTLNTLSIVQTMGRPPTDRLLLNLVTTAQKEASPLAPLPADFDAEMDRLGIKD